MFSVRNALVHLFYSQLALPLRVLPLRVLPVTQVASSAIRENIVGSAAQDQVNRTYLGTVLYGPMYGPGCSRAAPFRGPPPPPPPASACFFFASARFLFIAIMAAALPGISDLLRLFYSAGSSGPSFVVYFVGFFFPSTKTGLIVEMKPGLLFSGRHSLPGVLVLIYRLWRNYRSRLVVAGSLIRWGATSALVPPTRVPRRLTTPRRLTAW
jgi:hypothetical protein